MKSLRMTKSEINGEISRIISFISAQLPNEEKVVMGISGGIDSDVVARLTTKSIGKERLKIFTVIQQDMELAHLENARLLAKEIDVHLVEIDLKGFPYSIMSALSIADPQEQFQPDGLLDPSRLKCSLRTVVFSSYLEHGYVVIGTTNRTEAETGFFLPFGDGLAHIEPIVHLYKTQVRHIARALGTQKAVLDQPASAGFWLGQEDLEDLAYWLYNGAPVGKEIKFNADAQAKVAEIRAELTIESLDLALLGIKSKLDNAAIEEMSGLSSKVIYLLRKLTIATQYYKNRPLFVRLED